jgi:hypothetical protein
MKMHSSKSKRRMSFLRLKRAVHEKSMKVLSCTCTDDRLDFLVCGSTENEYTISFKENCFTCSCPDFERRRTFCKHVYLVYLKVLQIVPNIDEASGGNTVDTSVILSAYANYASRTTEMRESHECPICFDEFSEGQTPVICSLCRNGFHDSCVNEMRKRGHTNCPFCRSELRTDIGVESSAVNSAVQDILKRKPHRL